MKKFTFYTASFLFILCLFSQGAFAQTFKAQGILGLNAGQIDGDFEVGYNKLGISGGLGIGINLSKKMYLGTEFLYSQRGSKNALFRKDGVPNGSIRLDYIELPIIFRFLDWYQEEDEYNKVWLEGGLSAGSLIFAQINGAENPNLADEFSSVDFSFILGAGYAITKKIGIRFRYTRSIVPFYKAENPEPLEVKSLLSYFLTLSGTYTF